MFGKSAKSRTQSEVEYNRLTIQRNAGSPAKNISTKNTENASANGNRYSGEQLIADHRLRDWHVPENPTTTIMGMKIA